MPFQFSPPVPAKLTNVRLSREQIQALTETIAQSVAASFTVVPAVSPTFRNHDLKNQFYFNSEIIQLLQTAQTQVDTQQTSATLEKATSLLTERNEFLVAADRDPSVWEYYELHRQAERFKTSNPILASYFKEKMKKHLRRRQHSSIRRHHSTGGSQRYQYGSRIGTNGRPFPSVLPMRWSLRRSIFRPEL